MPVASALRDLGLRLDDDGGRIRVFSAHATGMTLRVADAADLAATDRVVELERDADGVFEAAVPGLSVGDGYSIRADGPTGPQHRFDPERDLLDPWSRGLSRTADDGWRSRVPDERFDWGGSVRPATPLDHTVIYEAHVRGLTMRAPGVPDALRGTYAGLAHPSTLGYLTDLGVTAVELLPVHQSVSERRLVAQGRTNYWGYNTLNFFTPHAGYATATAQAAGPSAVLREFKSMVRALHDAGLEVILDVVYNHTAEEGLDGPITSFRGIDAATYYRHDALGRLVDTTGCGNTLDTSTAAVQQLVLDSLRYWATEVRVDGFRFDLAASLGRDAQHAFDPAHPLLETIVTDPDLAGLKMIAEPWDVGPGGWQTGAFPRGFLEWNDGFRDRMRDFWLTDAAAAHRHGSAPVGIGPMAGRLAGSDDRFTWERGPLTSVNFVTAHDGFTLHDLTAYDVKHNLGNGEDDRDGSNDNRSWNHGVEGDRADAAIRSARTRTARGLLGALLLSAGVPMLTAGDELGRTQSGNNNAYNTDAPLTWLDWEPSEHARDLHRTVRTLLALRRAHPALRPVRFGRPDRPVPSSNRMDWYDRRGLPMTEHDWNSPGERTLQYLGASTPELEAPSVILLVVHGLDADVDITLPAAPSAGGFRLLWDSAADPAGDDADATGADPGAAGVQAVPDAAPGTVFRMPGSSMRLFAVLPAAG